MQAKAIKGVLFDKDGTLLHYEETWAGINRLAAERAAAGNHELAAHLLAVAGVDPETGKTRSGSALAAGNSDEIAELWAQNGALQSKSQLVAELDAIFSSSMLSASAILGAKDLLRSLKKNGLSLGVASSDSEAAIRKFLQATGLAPYIDFVTGYDSGNGHKPSPGMLLAFCAACGLEPEDVLVVGDNPQDIIMARQGRAGLAVGVLTGTGTHAELAAMADAVLPDILGIPKLISFQQ